MAATDVIFTTERLIVRRFTPDDEADLSALLLDPTTTEFLALPPIRESQEVHALLTRSIAAYEEPGGPRAYAVESLDGDLIGFCAHHAEGGNAVEIMYALAGAERGKGLGMELARGVTHECHARFPEDAVTAYVASENTASIRILERLAFQNQGFTRHQGFSRPVLRYAREPKGHVRGSA